MWVLVLFLRFSFVFGLYGGADPRECRTILVSRVGPVEFSSVQEAINSVPSNNSEWVCIHVQPGIYQEKVTIPKDKPNIALTGEGRKVTVIQWSIAGYPKMKSAFTVLATNFTAANISFKNSYNAFSEHSHTTTLVGGILQAPAAFVRGDRNAFYNCGFHSVQDTLADIRGRHFYKNCYIEGAIDFIWGFAQSVFQACTINATTSMLNGTTGTITAQGRESADDASAFVFLSCSIVGDAPVLLGRAYRQYSRVVFKNTYMSRTIAPAGWNAWHSAGTEDDVTYVEVDCKGPGANKDGRVTWEKGDDVEDLQVLTDVNAFINQERWIQHQPFRH